MSDPTEIPAADAAGPQARALAARYGADRPRRRWVALTLGGLLAAALLAWAVWAGSEQGRDPLEASVSSYRVVSTHEIQVKISAQFHDAGVDGSCLVRATAEDHTVVGELNLTGDQLREDSGRWVSIRTERRATTAIVESCAG
ncbi:hypothetical protein ACVW00_000658 [Marmoricola sp. URHA0025 HA25]